MAIRWMWNNVLLALLLFHVSHQKPAVKDVVDVFKRHTETLTREETVSSKGNNIFIGKNATLQSGEDASIDTTTKNPFRLWLNGSVFGTGTRNQARVTKKSSSYTRGVSFKDKDHTTALVIGDAARFLNDSEDATKSGARNQKNSMHSKCSNRTLKIGEYTISKDGFLHMEKPKLSLDSSHYIKNGNLVTVCVPTDSVESDDKYSEILHITSYAVMNTVISLCFLVHFRIMIPLVIMWFHTSSIISAFFSLSVYPRPSFFYGWSFFPIGFVQTAFLLAAFVSLLTCSPILTFLRRYGFFRISDNTVTLNVLPIFLLFVSLLILFPAINFLAYLIPFTPKFSLDTGSEVGTRLLYNCPAHLFLVLVSLIVEALSDPHQRSIPGFGINLPKYHTFFFRLHIYLFISEIFGLCSVICWLPLLIWIFSVTSHVVPTFLAFHFVDY